MFLEAFTLVRFRESETTTRPSRTQKLPINKKSQALLPIKQALLPILSLFFEF